MKKYIILLIFPLLIVGQDLSLENFELVFDKFQRISKPIATLTTSKFNNNIIINCGAMWVKASHKDSHYKYRKSIDEIHSYNTKFKVWSNVKFEKKIIPKIYANGEIVNEKLYLFNGNNNIKREIINDSLEIINLSNGKLHYGSPNPYSRSQAGSAQINNNIYFFGGSRQERYTNTFYCYNTTSDSYEALPNMPEPKNTRGEIIKNKLYTVGGYNGLPSNKIDIFNFKNNRWEDDFIMPFPISAHALAKSSETILIIGDYSKLNNISLFNTSKSTFITVDNNMIGCRHTDAEIIDNRLYVIGGINNNGYLDVLQSADLNKFFKNQITDYIMNINISVNKDFISIKNISKFDSLNYKLYDIYSNVIAEGRLVKSVIPISVKFFNDQDSYLTLSNSSFSKTFKIKKNEKIFSNKNKLTQLSEDNGIKKNIRILEKKAWDY